MLIVLMARLRSGLISIYLLKLKIPNLCLVVGGIMLVKTKIENEQNCVKIEQPSLEEFLNPGKLSSLSPSIL